MSRYALTAYKQSSRLVSPAVRAAAGLLSATTEPQARELTHHELADKLLALLAGLPMLLGHSNTLTEAADLNLMADSVAEMIQQEFPAFRFSEISAALRQGTWGKWKIPTQQYVLVALPSITHALTCYQQTRAEAIRFRQAQQEQEEETAREQQKRNDYEQQRPHEVAQLAAAVAATGEFPKQLDLGGSLYRWLKYIRAFRGFKTELEYSAMKVKETHLLMNTSKRNRKQEPACHSVHELLSASAFPNPKFKEAVDQNCQKRLLREWIEYHVAQGTDLYPWLLQLDQKAKERATWAASAA